jgi:hypothetical protein
MQNFVNSILKSINGHESQRQQRNEKIDTTWIRNISKNSYGNTQHKQMYVHYFDATMLAILWRWKPQTILPWDY